MRAEFDPLIKKYVDSMTKLKIDHSRKDRERKRLLNAVEDELQLRKEEVNELNTSLRERDDLFEIMVSSHLLQL